MPDSDFVQFSLTELERRGSSRPFTFVARALAYRIITLSSTHIADDG